MNEIHPDARVSQLADLEPSVRGTRTVIGARSVVDSFVKFKPAGGIGSILIGEDCIINSGCVIYSGNGILIGNHVSIAANCTLAPVNHEVRARNMLIQDQGFQNSKGGIVIEDDVWIGAGCILLDGSVLRKGCVVGAGSLVRQEVKEYAIVAGIPLREIGSRR